MSNFFGTALTGNSSSAVYDGPTFEGYNVEHGGAYAIAMESAHDQLGIIAAIAELDVQTSEFVAESAKAGEEGLSYVAENFEPVLEASGAGVLDKVKKAMTTLWGKVRAFFASVLRTLDGLTKSTEDFVKKYKSQIEKLQLAGFKHEMYEYTVDALNIKYDDKIIRDQQGVVDKIVSTVGTNRLNASDEGPLAGIDTEIEKLRDGRDEALDAFRGSIVGQGALDTADFKEHIHKALRGGKDSAEERAVNVHKIMEEVKGTSKLKEKINKAQKEADKIFGDAIKMVSKLTDAINKASVAKSGKADIGYKDGTGGDAKIGGGNVSTQVATKAATIANIISSTLSAQQGVVNSAITEWNAAVKERDGVYKKVLIKAFSHKPE